MFLNITAFRFFKKSFLAHHLRRAAPCIDLPVRHLSSGRSRQLLPCTQSTQILDCLIYLGYTRCMFVFFFSPFLWFLFCFQSEDRETTWKKWNEVVANGNCHTTATKMPSSLRRVWQLPDPEMVAVPAVTVGKIHFALCVSLCHGNLNYPL